ncbi:hypothetical protein [Flavobacterium sp.]|uniref:hypothetical protein n=1 Tax=Flavobacterium sp. TaxID=239 RepID=UPI002B4ADAA4|nr:hypothetical protein [Flavobacterium sp.]HLP64332.1 hypothetical protein [Flavobacterium sp.]
MKTKNYILLIFFLHFNIFFAQVGIGTTTPDSQLDIRSSNQAAPANNDGVLIPKVDVFPATNPTAAQQGMLVYLTTTTTFLATSRPPGFYYWNNPTSDWIGLNSSANGDHDWYEQGTTTAPNAITDNMFHTGNVGIGMNTPLHKLDIEAPGNVIGLRLLSGNNNDIGWLSLGRTYEYAQIGACTPGTFFTDALAGDMAIKNFNTGKLLFGASYIDTADMSIIPGGNVGINTSSPGTLFDVRGINNWNTATTEGDVRIGDPTYRFKIGVATGGAGAGDIRLTAQGGTNRIFLGNSVNNTLTTIDGLNNRVGIKNVILPNSVLDVAGDLALREGAAINVIAGGNVVILNGENSHYRLAGAAGAYSINTILNGNDGQLLTLINTTGQTMTVLNNNVANGILTGTGGNLVSSSTGNSSVTLMYNATLARWVVTSSSGMTNSNSWNITGNAGTNGGNTVTAGTNFIGTTDNQNIDFRTNNIFRGRFSGLGEFFVGTLNTVLTGDLMNAVGNVTFPWASNGYTAFDGAGTYGQVTGGTTIYAGVQGEYNGTNAQGTGVRGLSLTATPGTSFTAPHSGVSGGATTGGSYKFGTYGSGGTSIRSGGVLGNDFGIALGALGYYSSAFIDYSVYGFGQAHTNGVAGGRFSNDPMEKNSNIGLGIYGGVMGGWVRGMKYGFHTKGETYSLYVDGNGYTNKPLAYLISTDGASKTASYMSTSIKPEVTVNGKTSLEGGKVFVAFDKAFSQIISNVDDVIITASPQGKSNGIYIDTITKDGFWVYENNDGTSNVKISWIAITKIKGEENPEVPSDLLANDFDKKMDGVMFNENNSRETAQSLWWDGNQIRWDRPTNDKADTETDKLARPKEPKNPQ